MREKHRHLLTIITIAFAAVALPHVHAAAEEDASESDTVLAIGQEKAKLEREREELAAEIGTADEPAPDSDTVLAIEQEKAKLDRERQKLTKEFALADETAAAEEQKAIADTQSVVAPVGLTITSPPGPSGNQLFSIRAEQVNFRNVALCLARKASVSIRLADGIHSTVLNEPVSADLRLVSIDDALEILSGAVGLSVDSGIDDGRSDSITCASRIKHLGREARDGVDGSSAAV